MKNLWILPAFAVLSLVSCKNTDNTKDPEVMVETADLAYSSYGEQISSENSLSAGEMEERFKNLKEGDTIEVSFKTKVNSVCKGKGCWMTLDLPQEEDVMVKFKDYGFFVPMDIEEKEVVVNGKAFVAEVSVEEQQHYAEDKGDSPGKIAAITRPKRTLTFLADGVLIKD
ncbi:DUF4920 domain-containing protein [Antarcticibacterium arcticum]|uniref:DUF4920 domain-containing protein n=1 Tax=Antarcticibacterium arcticum TaxID=2585771 RepID=A0A5B8YIP8_9FLAO|nr:DUF4920 domain-containing protein [Antarcticibacterium arcticum]QED37820.1 DUF4920 domain-containing protein [Antarcticibacterium arcticum]